MPTGSMCLFQVCILFTRIYSRPRGGSSGRGAKLRLWTPSCEFGRRPSSLCLKTLLLELVRYRSSDRIHSCCSRCVKTVSVFARAEQEQEQAGIFLICHACSGGVLRDNPKRCIIHVSVILFLSFPFAVDKCSTVTQCSIWHTSSHTHTHADGGNVMTIKI